MKTMWLLPVLAVALYGADITGKWTGDIEVSDPSGGASINTPVRAEFDQKKDAISGKIGRTEDDQGEPIHNARLEGKNLEFEVRPPEASGAMQFHLVVLSDDRMEGEMRGSIDVGAISGKVRLRKLK